MALGLLTGVNGIFILAERIIEEVIDSGREEKLKFTSGFVSYKGTSKTSV